MTLTIFLLLSGFGIVLAGVGLLGTLLGVRGASMSFGSLAIGVIMAGYYAGYIAGTYVAPRVIQNVGHVRSFAAFGSLAAASSLAFGLLPDPLSWFFLRTANGLCVVALYMVVESWLNQQSTGTSRGRVFSVYMTTTLAALAAGQLLLPTADVAEFTLFAVSAILISLGLVPIAVNRVTEPRIHIAAAVGIRDLVAVSPLGTAGALCAGILSGAFWGMAPVFGQRIALDESQIAALMTSTIVGGAALQWPIGHLSDRADRRIVLIITALATGTVAAVFGYIVMTSRPGLVPVSFLYGGLMFSLYGISVAHANDHLNPDQILKATQGLLLIFGIGALSGPLLAGAAMASYGAAGLQAVSTIVAIMLGVYGIYRTTRRAAPSAEDQTEFVPMVRTTPVALEMHPEADPEAPVEAEE